MRELYRHYPTASDFMTDYNPSLQEKLLRHNIRPAILAANKEIPTINLLLMSYGECTPREWLKIQLEGINSLSGVSRKMTEAQVYETADLIISTYYYLNVAEVIFFIAKMKIGLYGRFYGAVDPIMIMEALARYITERNKDIGAYETEIINKRNLEASKSERRVSYEEYLKTKAAAEAGDEEAKKRLQPP